MGEELPFLMQWDFSNSPESCELFEWVGRRKWGKDSLAPFHNFSKSFYNQQCQPISSTSKIQFHPLVPIHSLNPQHSINLFSLYPVLPVKTSYTLLSPSLLPTQTHSHPTHTHYINAEAYFKPTSSN